MSSYTQEAMRGVARNQNNTQVFDQVNFKEAAVQQVAALNMLLNDKLKFKMQVFSFDVEKKEQEINIKVPTSVEFDRVCGVLVSSNNSEQAKNSTIGIEIDGNEVLPADFDTAFALRQDNVGFYNNMIICNERANNSDVKVTYKDKNKSGVFPYMVKVTLWCSQQK